MRHQLQELTERIDTLEGELEQLKGLAAQLAGATESGPALCQGAPSASRRDLLRYGAVALGTAAAGLTASRAEAADGSPVVISAQNTGTGTTYLTTTNGEGFWAKTINGDFGLIGESTFTGVFGGTNSVTALTAGVFGASDAGVGQAAGVLGHAASPNAPAVHGIHLSGTAVRAEVPGAATSNAIAMYALNYSSYTGGAPGAGGFAVYGLSAAGHGLVGATAAAGAAAVVGATNAIAGAYAGAFYGPLIVSGNFTVVGGAKSAAVPHPDGSHRRLYCVESPDSWFEDFGEAALICGEATIALDRDFAAVVDASKYYVFLTGQDGRCDLAVTDKTPAGFRVKAATAGEGTFAWRVVAKRKDIAAPRFEPVEIPKEPTLPPVPDSVYQKMPRPPDIYEQIVGPSRRPKRKV